MRQPQIQRRILRVKPKDRAQAVPKWYRPGYSRGVRGAAWRRLRPSFKQFLRRKHGQGRFKVYRPEPHWYMRAHQAQQGGPRILNQPRVTYPEQGDVPLDDLEPSSLAAESLSPAEWLYEHKAVFVGLVAAATTVGLYHWRK